MLFKISRIALGRWLSFAGINTQKPELEFLTVTTIEPFYDGITSAIMYS